MSCHFTCSCRSGPEVHRYCNIFKRFNAKIYRVCFKNLSRRDYHLFWTICFNYCISWCINCRFVCFYLLCKMHWMYHYIALTILVRKPELHLFSWRRNPDNLTNCRTVKSLRHTVRAGIKILLCCSPCCNPEIWHFRRSICRLYRFRRCCSSLCRRRRYIHCRLRRCTLRKCIICTSNDYFAWKSLLCLS